MVTVNKSTPTMFVIDICRDDSGTIYVRILNQKGQERNYEIPQKKLLFLPAIHGPVKDALDFLLEEVK